MKTFFIFFISIFSLHSCSPSNDAQLNTEKPKEKTIIAIGDSLTIGLGLPIEDNYPSQLERSLRSLGYNYTIANA